MKRTLQSTSDSPVSGIYNGYKRFNSGPGNNSWNQSKPMQPSQFSRQNGGRSRFGSLAGAEDEISERDLDALKYKYGVIVAKLASRGILIETIRQELALHNPAICSIMASLTQVRADIIKARPNALQYVHMPFYVGLKLDKAAPAADIDMTAADDDAQEAPVSGGLLTYMNSARSVETPILRTSEDLLRYCTQLSNIMSESQMVESLEKDELVAEIEKQLDVFSADHSDSTDAVIDELSTGCSSSGSSSKSGRKQINTLPPLKGMKLIDEIVSG